MIPDILINKISLLDLGWIRESIDFPTPQAQSETVVVPGRNSPIRFNEALGLVSYQPRAFTIVLTMLGTRSDFNERTANVVNQFAGHVVQVILSEEDTFYYLGTVECKPEYDPLAGKGKLTITCSDGDSYKYHLTETVITVSGSKTVSLNNDFMPVVPDITVTAETTLSWSIGNDKFSRTLSAGTWTVPELQLFHGANTVKVTSTGTTTFHYREGRL